MYVKKYVKVTITMEPELLKELKSKLKILNKNKDFKYISQSSFIANAVKQLLNKGI